MIRVVISETSIHSNNLSTVVRDEYFEYENDTLLGTESLFVKENDSLGCIFHCRLRSILIGRIIPSYKT